MRAYLPASGHLFYQVNHPFFRAPDDGCWCVLVDGVQVIVTPTFFTLSGTQRVTAFFILDILYFSAAAANFMLRPAAMFLVLNQKNISRLHEGSSPYTACVLFAAKHRMCVAGSLDGVRGAKYCPPPQSSPDADATMPRPSLERQPL